jgi:selenocysteine lyase/cysteine desulfurase
MSLLERLWRGIAEIQSIRIYGPPRDLARTPTVSFRVAGQAAAEVSRRLSERGLFVSHGDFYATTAVERMGMSREGLVRVGLSCYSTAEEVDRLLDALRNIATA